MNTSKPSPTWADLWVLSSDMLNCSECHAPQFMSRSNFAFVHLPSCSREGLGQYPYLELLAMLQRMSGE